MKLTKLELKGFKSFGDKVVINFDGDITGIVGPNGCGKSNIVDAIRWVLGEHKSSILRSEKMEDIIFNGTKSRKAQQMAEVSLTFTNTKNILPVEYSEVTITRKYYRASESEYLLNGTRCRLKDITDLFLDTGIGPDSYAIIELAMVKDILKDKDNSRRQLIEEAAGILKFRARKKQTLKKLDDTDQDLERIKDVLYENERNLKEFKRQANQAERFYKIKEQYKESSIALARITTREKTEKFDALQKQINKENDLKAEYNKQLAQKEAEIEKIKLENVDKAKSLSTYQQKFNEHVEKIREFENDKNISNERLKYLNTKINELQKQIDEGTQSNERAKSEKKRLSEEKETEGESLTEMEQKLKLIKEDYKAQEKKTIDLQEKINTLSSPLIANKEKEIEQIREKLTQSNRQLDAKQNELNLTRSFVDNLEGFPEAVKFLKKNVHWDKEVPLVSDILTTSEKYRIAIEYYLEPYFNYYVVEKPQQALQAVNLLSEAAKGRSHFFVLSYFENLPTPKTNIPNTIPAIDVVEYEPKFRKLISYILDNVYIVTGNQQDLPVEDTEKTGKHANAILLTQNGKITKGKFSISGGSIGLFDGKRLDKANNLLKLQKEINTLASDINDLKISHDKKLKELEILKEKENEIKGYNQELATQNELFRQKSELFNQHNIEFINKQNKISNIDQQIIHHHADFESSKERLEKNTLDINKTNIEIKQLKERGNSIENDLIMMYKEKDKLQAELSKSEQLYYSVQEQIDKLEKEAKDTRHKRENSTNLIQQLQSQLNDIKLNLTEVKERLSVEFNIKIDDLRMAPPFGGGKGLEHGKPRQLAGPSAPELPGTTLEELKEKVEKLREQYDRLKLSVNPLAKEAYEEQKKRIDFLIEQRDDIVKAKDSLLETISEINIKATESFLNAFEKIKANFTEVFRSLFSEEDSCDLVLSVPDNPLDSDIKIIAKPKGKKPLSVNQLSGGEQALTAIALLFSIYLLKPAPFCIFDEVDAPLDDTNIGKFNNIIKKFSHDSQFIIITHNKLTIASTDIIYGITMVEQGVSRVVPVDVREYA
ncbi:MAG: AAA family ATPase [Cytophagales bacterium]|nr:AAA family ATPase [Cytophagales bacterium]